MRTGNERRNRSLSPLISPLIDADEVEKYERIAAQELTSNCATWLRIGEFAWVLENLLNRVVDGTVAIGDDLVSLLRGVSDPLGELLQQVNNGHNFPTPKTIHQSSMHCELFPHRNGIHFF